MASRSARSPRSRRSAADLDDQGGIGAFLSQHRLAVGGLTAFAVAFAHVTANAIWYQPHAHGGAFFATRPLSVQAAPSPTQVQPAETVIRLEPGPEQVAQQDAQQAQTSVPVPPLPQRTEAVPAAIPVPAAAAATGDPVIAEVQKILAGLNLYAGAVDGLTGPQTRAAIENYRRMVGLSVSAEIDDQLLSQLGAAPRAAGVSAPRPTGSPGRDLIETSSAVPAQDSITMRIQAGLKAFGNDDIEIDGRVGSRTKSAILEFQSLFGLPETGEPDQALYTKMREIGLTN